MKSIEDMAREAGLFDDDQEPLPQYLERFASLVREQYREDLLAGSGEPAFYLGGVSIVTPARAKAMKMPTPKMSRLYTADQLASAVLKERERCAEYAEAIRKGENHAA